MLYAYGKGNVHLTVLNGNDKITLSQRMYFSFWNFKTNSFLSHQLQEKELLSNSKVKHLKSQLTESSTPSTVSTASVTNWTQPLLKWTIRNHSNCGTNHTAIWGTITWNSCAIQIWWMGWSLIPRRLWMETVKDGLWASNTVNYSPRKQRVSQQDC